MGPQRAPKHYRANTNTKTKNCDVQGVDKIWTDRGIKGERAEGPEERKGLI